MVGRVGDPMHEMCIPHGIQEDEADNVGSPTGGIVARNLDGFDHMQKSLVQVRLGYVRLS